VNLLEGMNAAIAYIEAHLLDNLNIADVARVAGCSETDVQRIFYLLTDTTIAEYVRKRRLTLAAHELQSEKASVLEIALKYGYSSPDSFTRAFKQLHRITPSMVNKGNCALKSYGKITFTMTIQGVMAMEYRIVKKPEIHFIGKKNRVKDSIRISKEVQKLWDRMDTAFLKDLKTLRNEEGIAGLICDRLDGGIDYWIGCISDKDCPSGYEQIALPKSTWVIFEVLGSLRPSSGKMVEICKRIYSEWFVNSDYIRAPIPEIEFYQGVGAFWAEDLKSEIWIPIVKKE